MKKILMSKKPKITLLTLISILIVTTGLTIAYLQSKPNEVTNSFTIGNVTTKIVEDFRETDDPWTFNKQPYVKNVGYNGEGNDCFVRVRIVASPEEQLDLIGFEKYSTDWKKESDGYYYYQKKLKVGEMTSSPVFDSIQVKSEYRDTIEEFEVTVYQEAVQATMTAADGSIEDGTTRESMMNIWHAYEANEIPESFLKSQG